MKIIGITGGIGSGKTAVLSIFKEEYDAFVRKQMIWLTGLWSQGTDHIQI